MKGGRSSTAPRLIHLNGPPAVGKSTLARRFVGDRPGTLGLDVDLLVAMVGGWQDDFWATLPIARRLAAAMAREHLLGGRDVVLPQLVTSQEELAPYRDAADAAGAAYVEVVLLADADTTVDRFDARTSAGEDPLAERVGDVVEASGGDRLLAKIRADLLRYLEGRAPDLVLDSTGRSVDDTLASLRRGLEA